MAAASALLNPAIWRFASLALLAIALTTGSAGCTRWQLRDAPAGSLLLAHGGKSGYRIVVAEDASETDRRAANELREVIAEISGARLPIVTDDEPAAGREILVGVSRRLETWGIDVDRNALERDGFEIRTVPGRALAIVGGSDKGTLYGVYELLERLGCRWFTSEIERIPRRETLILEPIDDTQVPRLRYREVYYHDPMHPKFADHLRLNGNGSKVDRRHIVREKHRGWGSWCHTFFVFVPPDKYFDEHPEYYSLVNGERRWQGAQICLTNPDVLAIVVAEIDRLSCESPEDRIWDVSQNDCGGHCQCENCRAIDEREGTAMGSTLTFINQVAERLPHLQISTLAYQHTRRPPKTIRPRENVSIMLCSIECLRHESIATGDSNASFREDIQNWGRICDNVFIWDYVVQFANLVSPFPNQHVLQPDMQFFARHNTRGVFSQGSREFGGEFHGLRAYLLARLQWNPDCDLEAHRREYLEGAFGPAAEPIAVYIAETHRRLVESGRPLGIFGHPASHREGFLNDEAIALYDDLFDQAEEAVADDSALLRRVREARMPLQYAKLAGGWGKYPERVEVFDALMDTAEKIDLWMFNEWNMTRPLFRQQMTERLEAERALKFLTEGGPFLTPTLGVVLDGWIDGATYRYTLDGSEPTPESAAYEKPLMIEKTTRVRARAFADGEPAGPEIEREFVRAREVFSSGVARFGEEPRRIDVDITGAKRLYLYFDQADGRNWGDHANWGDMWLQRTQGKSMRLDQLNPIEVRQGWVPPGESPTEFFYRNRSFPGERLPIGDRTFQFGLGTHAPGHLVYDTRGENFSRLQGWVGIDARVKEHGSVCFRVVVEDPAP